ncbi:MAG: sulfite exporter TauE/SafE family protein [Candidatus Latescibacteria bacterium]|nr:sulfite exporter TauE/SafE family protein [Candidatus Latescibacterota bacterium]
MIRIVLAAVVILGIAVVMAMTGRGGGNFYVPVLAATGVPMHQAATTGQFILAATAIAALLVFQKHKTVDWKLALVIDPPTDVMAFIGGYYAHIFSGLTLKFIFAGLLVLSSFFMLRPIKERIGGNGKRFGFWRRQYGNYEYAVNLWLAIPITAATGLVSGMVGVSGGSFKIPLMVLACGVPMRIAVGTSSAMVAATALMGFFGHTIRGDFNPVGAIPLAVVAVLGGLLGGKFSIKTKPERLKRIFAYTTLAAAGFMVLNALLSIAR